MLAANPDMRVAGLKLKNALLGADLADTNLTPSVSANLGASGTKNMKVDILPHLSASRHRRGIPITG